MCTEFVGLPLVYTTSTPKPSNSTTYIGKGKVVTQHWKGKTILHMVERKDLLLKYTVVYTGCYAHMGHISDQCIETAPIVWL